MDPLRIIKEAIKAVPAVRFALGVAGIAAVVAIVLGLKLSPDVAVFGTLIVLGLMFILVLFSQHQGSKADGGVSSVTSGPISLLVWFYSIALVIVTSLFISSYFLHIPRFPFHDPILLNAARKFHAQVQFPGVFTLGRHEGRYLVVITSPQIASELNTGAFDLDSLRLRATIGGSAPQIGFDSHVVFDDAQELLNQQLSFAGWSDLKKVIDSTRSNRASLHVVSQSNWPSTASAQRILLWEWDRHHTAPSIEVSHVRLEAISNSGKPIYCQLFLWSGSDVQNAEFDIKFRDLTLEMEGTY